MNKKHLKILIALLALAVFAGAMFFLYGQNAPSEKRFVLENEILTGNQNGVVSLVNANKRTILSQIRLGGSDDLIGEASALFPETTGKGLLEASAAYADNAPVTLTSSEAQKTLGAEYESALSGSTRLEEILSREIEKTGSHQGYDILSIPIVKGDYWLLIQHELLPDSPEFILLKMGREINPNRLLHPIYPGERLKFVAPQGLLDGGLVNDPVEPEVPVEPEQPEDPIAPEVPEEPEPPAVEDPDAGSYEPVIVPVPQFEKEDKTSFMNNYVYSFTDHGFYAYDNTTFTLYEILLQDQELQTKEITSFEGVAIREFLVDEGAVYFTTASQEAVHVYKDGVAHKVDAGDYLEAWTVADGHLYYASQEALFHVTPDLEVSDYLYLGDETTDIFVAGDTLYVANRFGSSIAKSVIHKLDRNFRSLGWAEIGYARDTKVMKVEEGALFLKQNMQDQSDKLTVVSGDLALEKEVPLNRLHQSLESLGDSHFLGLSNGAIHVYTLDGGYVDGVDLQASAAYILH